MVGKKKEIRSPLQPAHARATLRHNGGRVEGPTYGGLMSETSHATAGLQSGWHRAEIGNGLRATENLSPPAPAGLAWDWGSYLFTSRLSLGNPPALIMIILIEAILSPQIYVRILGTCGYGYCPEMMGVGQTASTFKGNATLWDLIVSATRGSRTTGTTPTLTLTTGYVMLHWSKLVLLESPIYVSCACSH